MCQVSLFWLLLYWNFVTVNKNWETFSYLIFSLQQYEAWPSEILVGETEPGPKSQQSEYDPKKPRVGEGLLI